MSALDLIDTMLYPIHAPTSPRYAQLVSDCRASFENDGAVLLPGFLHAPGLGAMAADIAPLTGKTYVCRNEHNVYLDNPDPGAGADHPRNRMLRTDVGSIANDYLDPEGPLQSLYNLRELTHFIALVVGADKLHRSADPLGAVSVNVFAPGDGHAWHFDESPFSITLMVQPAETGGHFEYVRGIRSDGDGDIEAINRHLDNTVPPPSRLAFEPGTLSIFAGHDTMHRVTKVEGTHHRLVPVLTYSAQPGYRNSDAVRSLFWGRT